MKNEPNVAAGILPSLAVSPDSGGDVADRIESLDAGLFTIQPGLWPDRVSFLRLQRLVRQRIGAYVYLEVGSDIGASLLPHLLDPLCVKAISIDPRPESQADERGTLFHYEGNSTARMRQALAAAAGPAKLEKLATIEADASDVAPGQVSPKAHLVLIDAEHTNVAAFSDFAAVLSMIAEDAIVSFHDADLTADGIRNAERLLRYAGTQHALVFLPDRVAAIGFGRMAEAVRTELAPFALDRDAFLASARNIVQEAVAASVTERRQATPVTAYAPMEITAADRRAKILEGLDIASAAGIEIGPLVWPIVRKEDGDITYVDHVDTAALKAKYADHPSVPQDMIVAVDAVWGANTLSAAVGRERRFDYVLASHVVEHVPDLVGWLEELTEVLRFGGEIRLAVPDKRFTFDHLRRNSQLVDALAAYAVGARQPRPQQILDYLAHFATLDLKSAWAGDRLSEPPELTNEGVAQWLVMAREAQRCVYHDVHCWVFTPRSFGILFEQLVRAGLLKAECSLFHDTAQDTNEFIVGLRPCPDREKSAASWRRMADTAEEIVPGFAGPGQKEQKLAQRVAALTSQAAALEGTLEAARREAALLRQSTSWRITAPLRALASKLRH